MKTLEKIVDTIFGGIDESLYDREEAIDLIEIYAEAKAGQHETIVIGDSWISLEEKLPKQGQYILLYDKMFDKIDVWFVDKKPNLIDADYTHWMPLPTPPKSQ